jgi:hypothetical protein
VSWDCMESLGFFCLFVLFCLAALGFELRALGSSEQERDTIWLRF